MKLNKVIGRKGEKIALDLLQEKGYLILDKNWVYDKKELDIIAQEGESLVIVEVKARTWENYEDPAESINDNKIKNILEATEAYMFEHNIDKEVRFDLISVIFYEGHHEVEHIPGAFGPIVE